MATLYASRETNEKRLGELHCLGSGIQFELHGSEFFRIALNLIKWERPFIVKRGRCNLPPAGGKLHRLFHSSMPKFSVTPIHRKTREVQFATGGLQIAQTFPLIDAQIFGNAHES